MATTSLGPNYDPQATATALAQKYTQAAQQVLTMKTDKANATQKGLTDLRSALSMFQASLASLTGIGKKLYAQAATLSDTTLGSASATPAAAAGTYKFFVEQLATAHQVSYNNIPDNVELASAAGTLKVKVGASTISVDLTAASTDADPKLSVREIAAAINKASDNTSLVSASVVTVGGVPQLMLSSQNTGTGGAITLDTSAMGATSLKTAFDNAANFKEVVAAQDAKVWLGAQTTGTLLTQSSNTFTNVDGVSVTFTKAQASGATPVTLTVAPDNAGTTKNVQDFIDAYNKLKGAVDKLVAPGDPEKGVAAGPFAHDAGIRALRDRLVDLMRPGGATNLAMFGITGSKSGGLQLKSEDLLAKLAKDPFGLDNLIGSASLSTPTGIAGALNTYLKEWSDTANGKIKSRTTENEKLQKDLAQRQTRLDAQYDTAFQRYLLQFTRLQNLQSQMSTNLTMFDALFGNKSK